MPTLYVIGGENLIRHLFKLGSLSRVSVSAPMFRERKPNLTFKAPPCKNGDSRFPSTRQGGFYIPALTTGIFLIFLALTVRPVRKVFYLGNSVFSNGVKIFRGRIDIDIPIKLNKPINNIFFLQFKKVSHGVCPIKYREYQKVILLPI